MCKRLVGGCDDRLASDGGGAEVFVPEIREDEAGAEAEGEAGGFQGVAGGGDVVDEIGLAER